MRVVLATVAMCALAQMSHAHHGQIWAGEGIWQNESGDYGKLDVSFYTVHDYDSSPFGFTFKEMETGLTTEANFLTTPSLLREGSFEVEYIPPDTRTLQKQAMGFVKITVCQQLVIPYYVASCICLTIR